MRRILRPLQSRRPQLVAQIVAPLANILSGCSILIQRLWSCIACTINTTISYYRICTSLSLPHCEKSSIIQWFFLERKAIVITIVITVDSDLVLPLMAEPDCQNSDKCHCENRTKTLSHTRYPRIIYVVRAVCVCVNVHVSNQYICSPAKICQFGFVPIPNNYMLVYSALTYNMLYRQMSASLSTLGLSI